MKKATLLVFLCLIALVLLPSCKKDEAAAPAAADNAAAAKDAAAAPAAKDAAAPAAKDAAVAADQDKNKDPVETSIDALIGIYTQIEKASSDANGDCDKFGRDVDNILMDNKKQMSSHLAILEKSGDEGMAKYKEKSEKLEKLNDKFVNDLGACVEKNSANATKAGLTIAEITQDAEKVLEFINSED